MPHQKKEMAPHAPVINYCMKSEVFITLHYQLCSTHYTALQFKNCSNSTPAIKVATMKNTDDFHYEGKPSHTNAKSTHFTVTSVSKDEWDTKEGTGKSMKNTAICQKARVQLKCR